MNRNLQLRYCRTCLHHKKDVKSGILCRLTNELPSFEVECNTYHEDQFLKEKYNLEEVGKCLTYHQANQLKRIANGLIDGIIAILLFFLTINTLDLNQSSLTLLTSQNTALQFGAGLVSVILYFAIMEATTGRTIGKIITHTKVVNACGRKPSFKSIIMRSLLRVIPLNVLSFLIAHTDGWHDRWSKTTVITT